MGKIDWSEALTDIPEVLDLVNSAEAAVAALPPKETRKAVDYANALGFAPGGAVQFSCTQYDNFTSGPLDVDKVAAIIGATGDGVAGKLVKLIDKIEAQLKT